MVVNAEANQSLITCQAQKTKLAEWITKGISQILDKLNLQGTRHELFVDMGHYQYRLGCETRIFSCSKTFSFDTAMFPFCSQWNENVKWNGICRLCSPLYVDAFWSETGMTGSAWSSGCWKMAVSKRVRHSPCSFILFSFFFEFMWLRKQSAV